MLTIVKSPTSFLGNLAVLLNLYIFSSHKLIHQFGYTLLNNLSFAFVLFSNSVTSILSTVLSPHGMKKGKYKCQKGNPPNKQKQSHTPTP